MSEYRVEIPAHCPGAFARRARVLAGAGAALLVAAGAYSPPAAANVYEWKDAQNQVHYTDRPPPPGATLVSIRPSYSALKRPTGESSGNSESPRPAAPRAAEPGADSRPQSIRTQVQQDVANKRAEQCQQAQERYKKYIESRRLFREGANGERVYLSDQELEEARVNAKREVDATCAEAPR
jgi:hypothetical protein